MSHYFTISQGLRGCYMPDSCYTVRVDTRRELKAYLESEAGSIRDAGFIGCSTGAIAGLAALAWRKRKGFTLDLVSPYKAQGQDGYPYGLFVGHARRGDYLAYCALGD